MHMDKPDYNNVDPMVFLRVAQLFGIQKTRFPHLLLILVMVGCENEVWNNPHAPADLAEKIMYREFTSPPKHLDPIRSYNLDEATLIDQIYEPPLEYHYLKRPYELKPLTLTRLPLVEHLDEDGVVLVGKNQQPAFSRYTFNLKEGVMYQPHPAFATKDDGEAFYDFADLTSASNYKKLVDFKRVDTKELVADDYIYQIKRMSDPGLQFPIWDIVSEYIIGLKEMRQTVSIFREENPKAWLNFNDLHLSGVRKIDRYTFSITLNGIYPQFKYWLAFHFFAPIPMEVDRFYHLPGQQQKNITLDLHPVGTGAFMMTKHDASSEIVLEKNPHFREEYYPSHGELSDIDNGLLADAGKKLPFIDKIVFRLEKEAIPLWTKFLQGYYDRAAINTDSFDQSVNVSVDGIALSDEMQKKGVNLITAIEPATYYVGFNMLDPVVGGYSERNRKLRQAITIAYDEEEFISIFRNGRGEVAMSPIPPGIFGYQQGEGGVNTEAFIWKDNAPRKKSLEYAKELMRDAGYPDGRDALTGAPLILNFDTTISMGDDSALQNWRIQQFSKLGIQLNIRATDYNRFQDKMESGRAQIFFWGWFADYPDPENFLFLHYGPNGRVGSGGSGANSSNYDNPRYNELFNQMKIMPDSPERLAIIERMLQIYRFDAPWASSFHPVTFTLSNEWVRNYKPHGMSQVTLKYQDIDTNLRASKQRAWNKPEVWPLALMLVLFLMILIPGYRAYRRRQRRRII